MDNLVDHIITIKSKKDGDNYKLDDSFGLSFLVAKEERKNFGQALGQTFIDFGDAATAIVRGLGSLFYDAKAWQNVGGIVAIGFESTNILYLLS